MNARLPVNLMLVEDERIVAFDLKRQLQGFGYRVDKVVASGEQAVALLDDDVPDLVVMDIHLEGAIDGIEAAQRIHTRYGVPVVFLTAYAEDDTLRRALESRPFGYLVKPCEARELHATIQMALARRDAELAVENSELRLKLALDAASLGVLEWHPESDRLTAEGHIDSLFGTRPTPVDESWESFSVRVATEDRALVRGALDQALGSGSAVRIEFRTVEKGSAGRRVEAHAKAYRRRDGVRIVGILQDITQRHAYEEQLRQSSVVFQTTAEAVVITDARHGVVATNGAFSRITGYADREAHGKVLDELLRIDRRADPAFDALDAGTEGYWHGEVSCHRKDGESFPAWQSVSVVRNELGMLTHYVTAFSDITAIHAAQQKLQFLAHHDFLTGLPNRFLLDDRLEQAIEQARRFQQNCMLLFLDLDGFKVVNDTLGHNAGDELLRAVSARFRAELRSSDTVARVGGDEFVILPGSGPVEYAAQLAEKILECLRAPFAVAGESITVSGSLGIALFPENGETAEQLMQAADMAMYSAKAEGRNRYCFFSSELSSRVRERMHVEQGLRRALDGDLLDLYYQPQVSLDTGALVGVEALSRWTLTDGTAVSPSSFIAVAEESGIIERLGLWVLERACTELVGHLDSEGRQLRLAVNVSAQQFMGEDFVATVREVLDRTGFPPESLELEITESTLQVIERSTGILKSLKNLGVSISIDDFGTGYSSLSVLRDLPIDRIKIDRSFILHLPDDPQQGAIVEAVVALGHALGLCIIVEGIESIRQAAILRRLGCHEGQGFLFSPPVPIASMESIVRRGKLPGWPGEPG